MSQSFGSATTYYPRGENPYSPPRKRKPPIHFGEEAIPCPCPVCGGLECLCRPRFFAGQLLTDEDLNRLDNYIRAKNRLHNRYLHGWGTVCGLEVLCDRCPGFVNVTAGYALDPCGNDIIVCKDEKIDICTLIRECSDKEKKDPCDPLGWTKKSGCDEGTEQWLLYAEYAEKETRGVTSLRGASKQNCCDRCGCETSSSGQCGCGCTEHTNTNNGKNGNGSRFRPPPPQCEPTVVCETYRFGACRLPDIPKDKSMDLGPLLNRILNCWLEIIEALDPQAAELSSGSDKDKLCRAKCALERFMKEHPTTFCEWDERLNSINCQHPTQKEWDRLIAISLEYLVHCFCSAWLPQCPEDVCDARVPLAAITVTKKDCRVVRICNMTQYRQFVRTAPNMKYWLSPLQIGRLVREVLENLCCEGLKFKGFDSDDKNNTEESTKLPTGQPQPAIDLRDREINNDEAKFKAGVSEPRSARSMRSLGETIIKAFASSGSDMDVRQFYRSLTGTRDDNDNPMGHVKNVGHLPLWMAIRSIGLPVMKSITPQSVGGIDSLVKTIIGSGMLSGKTDTDATFELMGDFVKRKQPAGHSTDEMAAMQDKIEKLCGEVDELRKRSEG